MSSATTLIAVELSQLQAAVGSKDEALLQRALEQIGIARERPSYPLTLELLKDGGVLMNDLPITVEELKAELQKPERRGIKVLFIERRIGTPFEKAALSGIYVKTVHEAMAAQTVLGCQWEEPDEARSDEELPLEQAITELIQGQLM